MAQFGSKDFSTLDRNAALVNDVLATRMKYEVGKAEREKRTYQEQEAAAAINKLTEVYKQTHEEERWVPGKIPGQMEKQKVETEGPNDAELFQATNEAVARAARLGQPGQKAQEAARDMLYRWTQRKQAKEQFPQSSVDKYEFYLEAANRNAAVAREMMQRDALGVAQAQPYTGIEVETAEGPKIVQYNKATGKRELVDIPGGAKPSGSGGGGGGMNQITLDTGKEKITFKGKTQQDIQAQVRDAKQSIQPDVMGMTQRAYKVDPADLGEAFGPVEPSGDGMYYPSIDLAGISKQDQKALRDLRIVERILAQEYVDQKMLPEAAYARAAADIAKIYKWAAYDRAEANRETQGFGQGPALPPSPGGPTPIVGTPAPAAEERIKVRRKDNGKIGTIPVKNFDPNKHEKI